MPRGAAFCPHIQQRPAAFHARRRCLDRSRWRSRCFRQYLLPARVLPPHRVQVPAAIRATRYFLNFLRARSRHRWHIFLPGAGSRPQSPHNPAAFRRARMLLLDILRHCSGRIQYTSAILRHKARGSWNEDKLRFSFATPNDGIRR